MRGTLAVNVAFILTAMIVLARTYLQADKYGRRQVKWVLLGLYLGTVPVLAAAVAAGVDPSLWWLYEASMIATLAIPVCVFVALVSSPLDVFGDLRMEGRHEHPLRALAGDLVERLARLRVSVLLGLDYPEHGWRVLPPGYYQGLVCWFHTDG